jgi:hypothetical protein
MKEQQSHIRETSKMGKQLWPIESRPFGSSVGHFFLDEAERPEDVFPAQWVRLIQKVAEGLFDLRSHSFIIQELHHLRRCVGTLSKLRKNSSFYTFGSI